MKTAVEEEISFQAGPVQQAGKKSAAPKPGFFSRGFFGMLDDAVAKLCIVGAIAFLLLLTWWGVTYYIDEFSRLNANDLQMWFFLLAPLSIISFYVILFFWRLYLVKTYRNAPTCRDEELPFCSVIIPAYNEGRQVLDTILSVAASDYPADKLQIICIDDGSKDDTWAWMQLAAEELGSRIEVYQLEANSGKRHALFVGFNRAKGEVLVTIDSDSEVEPRTVRNLVSPFQHDPQVGAVAGNVRVLNINEGWQPRMLDVSFTYSFDFMRAAQSRVNTVMCTPGALSAYRASVVRPLLDEWDNQLFWGRPSKIGEDRALSNLVLREGYHVHFQSNAVVYTNVPTGYRGLCRMFMRWARSNVRETMIMSTFAFRKFRKTSAAGARVNLVDDWLSMTMAELLKPSIALSLLAFPFLTLMNLLWMALVGGLVPALIYGIRYRTTNMLWIFPFNLYSIFALSWINFVALFTPHRDSWLTRQAPAPTVAVPSSAPATAAVVASRVASALPRLETKALTEA